MGDKKENPLEGLDVIEATRKHLAENPVAATLDRIAAMVMDAADQVDRKVGPLSDRDYAAVVAALADAAVIQLAESVAKHRES